MKKFVGLLLCFIMLIGACVCPVSAEESNIEWNFDAETGTMTVSGVGRMDDYYNIIGGLLTNKLSPAWGNSSIKHVVVEEGITYIGEGAFQECDNLETVSLPDSLREIGSWSFYESCAKLKSIEFPAGVRRIGEFAFTAPYNTNIGEWTEIKFYGNPPVIEEYGLFSDFDGVVFYPASSGWTSEAMAEYEEENGAEIIWKAWDAPALDHIEEIFLDLAYGSWYVPAVDTVYRRGIMKGTGEGFSPDAKLTREQAVQVLYNMEVTYNATQYNGDTGFSDVPEGKWYSRAVKWAKEEGISEGIGGGRFGLGQMLTREQFATLLVNYAKNIGADTSNGKDISSFADATSVSSWAKEGIEWCAEVGIIKGTDTNRILPQGTATRAELAQMLSNYLVYRDARYQLIFFTDGGECEESCRLVLHGEPVGTLPLPVKEGYKFDGWEDLWGQKVTSSTVFDNPISIQLNAVWVQGNKVAFILDGGECEIEYKYVISGEALGTLPTPTREGYEFSGWKYNDEFVTEETVIESEVDFILTAVWNEITQ